MIDYKKQGKANRAKGASFELQVRKDLVSKGWFVVKFQNNIDLDNSCMVQAKQKFIKGRGMGLGSGFPDFLIFDKGCIGFIECKTNGILSKIEKLKMEWLNGKGFECWVAEKDGTSVEYKKPSKVRRTETRDYIR